MDQLLLIHACELEEPKLSICSLFILYLYMVEFVIKYSVFSF